MNGPLALLLHSFKRVRTLVLVTAVVLATFQVFLIIMSRPIHTSKGFAGMAELLPPFVRDFLGPALASFLSFGGMVSEIYFHPLVECSLIAVVIAISTTPTREIESGFMDLVMSRPMARHWVITRTIIVVAISIVASVGSMVLAMWAGLHFLGPEESAWPKPRMVWSLAANLALLLFCWAGVATAVGSASRRRGVAGAIVGFAALTTFLLDYVVRAWRPAECIAWLSPFHYSDPLALLMGHPLLASNLLVLASIAFAGFGMAYLLFSRRDLSR